MHFRRSSSIYLLISLLIIVGILIFVLKSSLLSYLSVKVFGANETGSELTLQASAASVINLQILENKQFERISDHVLYFDFNYVGKPVVNKNAPAGTKAPAWSPVYLGNSNPFFVPVEKDTEVDIDDNQ